MPNQRLGQRSAPSAPVAGRRYGCDDLAAFAAELSARLPETWTVTAHEHITPADQYALTERLWDDGHVSWAFSEFILERDAVLTNTGGDQLVVVNRPLHQDQFLVAALTPHGGGNPDAADAPSGIAVSDAPIRAAATVTARLLPRFERAVRQVRDQQLAAAVTADKRTLAVQATAARARSPHAAQVMRVGPEATAASPRPRLTSPHRAR